MKTKHFLFTIALCILSVFTKAQDKYEFMTIGFDFFGKEIVISINGKQFIREEAVMEKTEKNNLNTNPLLAKINEYQAQNWEVVTFATTSAVQGNWSNYYAFLKRKIVEKK